RSLILVTAGLWSTAALGGTGAIVAANNQVGGAWLTRHVNYTETDSYGVTVDTEKGRVPGAGLFASFMYGHHHGYLALSYEAFKGTTDYTGQLTSGGGYGSLVGKSGAKITDIAVRDGVGIPLSPGFMLTPYVTLGYHKWERNVTQNMPSGYNETYQHGYYGAGLMGQYSPARRLVLSGRVMLGHTDGARIDVPSVGLSEDLGGGGLYQLGLGVDYAVTTALHAGVRAAYTAWRYGAGAPIFVGYYNSQAQYIHEPDSRTADATLKLDVGYAF
ncbi:MAG TPA: hypothetical protein VFN52_00270, partial [Acidiferrobacteraceae bacterium]|nr:hypothetical protein [Acidiferrobacteraceae bacterium]